jgi:hypothetical protein
MIKLIDVTPVIKTKAQARELFTTGNNKLSKDIAIFNLPATMEVCGRICKGCFAMKAQVLYPSVLPSREGKLTAAKQADFEQRAIESIAKLGSPYVRIHESGEFFSQEYVDSWATIAAASPNVQFLAYTKRLADWDFSALRGLPNVIVISSLFGKSINYSKDLSKKPAKASLCPTAFDKTIGCLKGCDLCYNPKNKEQLETNGIFFKQH